MFLGAIQSFTPQTSNPSHLPLWKKRYLHGPSEVDLLTVQEKYVFPAKTNEHQGLIQRFGIRKYCVQHANRESKYSEGRNLNAGADFEVHPSAMIASSEVLPGRTFSRRQPCRTKSQNEISSGPNETVSSLVDAASSKVSQFGVFTFTSNPEEMSRTPFFILATTKHCN